MSLEEPDSAGLSRETYESLLDAAETYREALVIRLCGDVGLRPTELTDLTVDDVEQVRIDPPRYLVRVPAADGEMERTAYLPTRAERELRRYARSNGLTTDDRIFPVTPRRLQMLVSDVADRAADLFDRPALAELSTSDLRAHFAHRSLVDHSVNPRVVKATGGWRSFEALEPYLSEPTDAEIVDAFERIERPTEPGHARTDDGPVIGDDSVIRLLLAASERYALLRLDTEGYVDRWNRSAASMFGYRAGEVVGTHVSTFYSGEAVTDGDPERALSTALEESGHEHEGWRVHKDGTEFRVTEVISPLRDDQGRHRGFAVFVRDVSAAHEELEAARDRRAELERRDAVARAHRAVGRSLLESTDHEAIETNTCASLVGGSAYEYAWIDRPTHTDWRAASGIEPTAVDALVPDDWNGVEPDDDVGVTAETGIELPLEDGTATGGIACVPLTFGDTAYGTLTVATSRSDAFDEEERRWLETTGRQVGYAIAAIRRRNLLLSDRVVELELVCRDDDSFFVSASRELDCRFELDSLVPVSESTQLYYLHLEGAEPGAVFDLAADDPGIEDARLVETRADGWRVEFVVEGSSPALTLTEYGVTVLEAVTEDGVTRLTGECAADADLRTIVGGVRSAFPDADLAGKRDAERAVQTAREFREGLEARLTDRQEASLRAAYFGGYYDWPRESTAEEIADAMGISSPTLHNHLRKGQHELLRTFFDDPNGDTAASDVE